MGESALVALLPSAGWSAGARSFRNRSALTRLLLLLPLPPGATASMAAGLAGLPSRQAHRRTDPSELPDASSFPSALQARQRTWGTRGQGGKVSTRLGPHQHLGNMRPK